MYVYKGIYVNATALPAAASTMFTVSLVAKPAHAHHSQSRDMWAKYLVKLS